MQMFKISDLNILLDSPYWTLHENFNKFRCCYELIDINIKVCFAKLMRENIIRGNNVFSRGIRSIYSDGGNYHILINEMDIPSCIKVSEDFSDYTLFLDPIYDDPLDEYNVSTVKDRLFDAIRNLMSFSLSVRKGVIIHSVAMEWASACILFSAPSGTGKTTHTNLWRQKYGSKIINGDNSICRIVNGLPMVYGLPWCGTSGEFANTRLPLGAIVFIEQNKENNIEKLNASEAFVRLYARSYIHTWDEKMADQVLETVTQIALSTECYLLKCRPDFGAVELVKGCLECII